MRTRMRTRRTGRRSRPRRCRRRRLTLSRGSARGRRPRPLPPDSTRPHPSRALVTPAMFFGCVVASFAPGFEPGSRGSASAGVASFGARRGDENPRDRTCPPNSSFVARRSSAAACRPVAIASSPRSSWNRRRRRAPPRVTCRTRDPSGNLSSRPPRLIRMRASARAGRSCAAAAPHRVGK